MSTDYVWEKFYQAVEALATGDGDLKMRLFDAFIYLHRLRFGGNIEHDVPDKELRHAITGILDDMSWMEAQGDEGRAKATINSMDELERGRIAQRILSTYIKLEHLARD